jgi:hypothetical protein
MHRSKSCTSFSGRARCASDDGSAALEFVTAGLILLLPLVYLVLVMSAIQAGALATEGAARQAARVFVQSPNRADAAAAASRAIDFALADFGIEASDATVTITCRPKPQECLTRRGYVTVSVAVRVPLPLMPPVLSVDAPLTVPLSATATQQVSRFWGSE